MIRLVIANQRGGVGKTTAAVNYAWYLANIKGLRTLLIDTDSQGSVGVMLNLKPKHYFSHFLVNKFHLDECTISAGKNLQVLVRQQGHGPGRIRFGGCRGSRTRLENHVGAV